MIVKKVSLILVLLVLLVSMTGCLFLFDSDILGSDTEAGPVQDESGKEPPTWKDNISESLAVEIENAVAVIDENEMGIFTVTGVDLVRENVGYICTFRYYKLTVHWSFEPTENNREYVIRTREWHDGEPEKEEYPNEYLECINKWVSEDNLTGGTLIWSIEDGYIV